MEMSKHQSWVRRLKNFAIFFMVVNGIRVVLQAINVITSLNHKPFEETMMGKMQGEMGSLGSQGQEAMTILKQAHEYQHSLPFTLLSLLYLLAFLAIAYLMFKEWRKLRQEHAQADRKTKQAFLTGLVITIAQQIIANLMGLTQSFVKMTAFSWLTLAISILLAALLYGICLKTYANLAKAGEVADEKPEPDARA